MSRFGIAGPVGACAGRVGSYLEAGAEYIVLGPVCGNREWPEQVAAAGELIAKLGAGRR